MWLSPVLGVLKATESGLAVLLSISRCGGLVFRAAPDMQIRQNLQNRTRRFAEYYLVIHSKNESSVRGVKWQQSSVSRRLLDWVRC